MFSHVNNCCNPTTIIGIGKIRPACGRELMSECVDVETNGLRNSILDDIWSKPLWYHKKFEVFRAQDVGKPETSSDYKAVYESYYSGQTFEFKPTDHFAPYYKKACDTVYSPNKTKLFEKYNFNEKYTELFNAIKDDGDGHPCVYPNCWISAAESNKAKCSNKYYKLIAHYPSIGRPFQTAGSAKSTGLRNTNISPDSIPGRQVLEYEFELPLDNELKPKKVSPVEGSHDKGEHQNTAYPGKYWISWWNGIHPGNIIGYEGVNVFDNPYKDVKLNPKLSEQIICENKGNILGGGCEGITFIQEFEKQATNKVIKLSSGFKHSCIVTTDGKCFCWGEGYTGGKGYGQANVPVELKTGKIQVVDVNCGGNFTVATLADNTLWGWGDNSSGQLNFEEFDHTRPKTDRVNKYIKKIATGGSHTVALMQSDIKILPNGTKKLNQNTLRIWGDVRNGKTIVPKVMTTRIGPFADQYPQDFKDFLTAKYPGGNYDLFSLESGEIIPWWPIIKNTLHYDGDSPYILDSLGTNGLYGLIEEYENSKNVDGVYNTPVSTELEFEDVWAGKNHTIGFTKSVARIKTKKYNTKFDDLIKEKGSTAICGYSAKLEMDGVIPSKVLQSHLKLIGDAGLTCDPAIPGTEGRLKNERSIYESVEPTNVFVWGAGMQMGTQTDTSSNFDYSFYNHWTRISRSGSAFPRLIQDRSGKYYVKTNASSEHSIILGKRYGSFNRPDSRCWYTDMLQAWGWGDNVYDYMWNLADNPSEDLFPRQNTCKTCDPLWYKSADCYYYSNSFVINGINDKLNLYKESADTFFQFAYLNGSNSCKNKIDIDCGSDLGGWTFSTEIDINETSFDYSPYTGRGGEINNLMLRTGKGRTYVIERVQDQWNPSNGTKRQVTCYGDCEDQTEFKTYLDTENDIDFFESGLEHNVIIQRKTGNSSTTTLNFPYNVPGIQEPFDRTTTQVWTQNENVSPRIQNYPNYSNFKNDTHRQPIFDEETSSRLKYDLNVEIIKFAKVNGNYVQVASIKFNTLDPQSMKLVGTRGDQRLKPFTGATCDCMWSDWATDPLKIGGHSGVILNETTNINLDESKYTIPWDGFAGLPDRKLVIDQFGVEKINYYSAPPNVLTHNLIEIPPGRFPSQLALPCRQKFCEGGVNTVIRNWCDPCFGGISFGGKSNEKWAGRLGCTGCEFNYNNSLCTGCTFSGSVWVCPPSAPRIRDVYGYYNPESVFGTTVEKKINSFGEVSTPIEEAWPSMNRYFIPRWSNTTEDITSKKYTEWNLTVDRKTTKINEVGSIDYPLVVVPAHGGDIGTKYDFEAYQDIALSASLGSIDEYANKAVAKGIRTPSDAGVRYITDFKDTEYPYRRTSGLTPNFTSPNAITGSNENDIFYPPPEGVTFRTLDFSTNSPTCGNTETGCSSCAIPFTGAEIAAWGFDLYSPQIVSAVQSFIGLNGDPISDPEIGNIDPGGVWLGIAKDRFADVSTDIKKRIRFMFGVNLAQGEYLSFGKGVSINGNSNTFLNDVSYNIHVNGTITQYPNDTEKVDNQQKYENYEYRWGRFNDECGCSSRITVSPDIFLVDPAYETPTITKLKAGKISELTNKEKASIIIGGKETKGLGLLQYWNCNNPVTYIESGESPLLSINNGALRVGLCDIDNRKPTFVYETQEYLGDGAVITSNPINTNSYYRGEYNVGFIFNYFDGTCTPPTACPVYKGMNSPGTRGIWSHWLADKGWSNFYTNLLNLNGSDDKKDRMGGDIPFESSHPQGWLGFGSVMPHMRTAHKLSETNKTIGYNTMSISSMSDLTSTLRDYTWGGGFEGIISGVNAGRDAFFTTGCGSNATVSDADGQIPYVCGQDIGYNSGRTSRYKQFVEGSGLISPTNPNYPLVPENPKTQKLKACCFGNGFEHEVYSTVTRSFVPDTFSRTVKINKYRNLYNALWHANPINVSYIDFRPWHGDPYSPDYCTGSANCKTRYSPVWFDYWYPSVADFQGGAAGAKGFNLNKNILHWRHKRWDLPMFIGVNRDNIGNFYIHDPNCGQNGVENCSGFELVDFSFPTYGNYYKAGWDHRSYDSITAQSKLKPDSLYFYKSDRGALNGADEAVSRGSAESSLNRKVATFYTVNGDVWIPGAYEVCVNVDATLDIFGGLFGNWFNLNESFCFRGDNSRWNDYFLGMGPGYVYSRPGEDLTRKFKANFQNDVWY